MILFSLFVIEGVGLWRADVFLANNTCALNNKKQNNKWKWKIVQSSNSATSCPYILRAGAVYSATIVRVRMIDNDERHGVVHTFHFGDWVDRLTKLLDCVYIIHYY